MHERTLHCPRSGFPPQSFAAPAIGREWRTFYFPDLTAYFAATFLGQKMKLRILCEKLLIISHRFFGIPPFRFYALADGIKNVLTRTSPDPWAQPPPSQQLQLVFGWEGQKI